MSQRNLEDQIELRRGGGGGQVEYPPGRAEEANRISPKGSGGGGGGGEQKRKWKTKAERRAKGASGKTR